MRAVKLIFVIIGFCLVTPASSFCPLAAPCAQRCSIFHRTVAAAEVISGDSPPADQTPLIDLQTFLKLCDLVQTGGEAKAAVQSGKVRLNWEVETRRAKKLFAGDEVSYGEVTLDVSDEVGARKYTYKPKKKKVKPAPKVMADGGLEFGGRYRSEEWRAERKQKKLKETRKAVKKDE